MTSRKLSILAIVAVIAVLAGLWLAGRQTSPSSTESAALYPDLKSELASITAVRIVKAGGAPALEVKRAESGWTVAERHNYPADEAKLRKLVTSLADAKVLEEKTSNPESYKTLGVEDVSDAAAGGVQIEIDGPKQPIKLIVGKQAQGAQSHYVRRAGEPKSWLINKSIDTSSSADQWLRKDVIDVSADRVQSAEVAVEKSKPYSAVKKTRADADFTVEGLPKGKELSSPSAADSFATALAGLTLSDVKPASEVTDSPSARATIKTFDGLVTEVTGWKKDDKHYVALKTSFDAALADKFKVATADPEKKEGEGAPPAADKPAEAAKPAARNVEEESTKANAQLNGWVYEIPAYKYDAIFKPLDELIKK
ncbi:hypothetical protein GCM10011487_65090 [Steroidobacter agaridevorans]|uniref:DUF4340 domain-containing protein n=1 Tax=Steroidobacter agaridevorans TaxID=2695856 RepID=A0A829YMY0_9GAMM|nr:DUF4340 domain-containing protein [Steroidobacter agaridevorans]GFE84509.1 hypothetical protein GCM10011487_65090 [Steroidobacter agaridevorans]GFE90908.1 hypothetical protein GCM10011488_58620 [Steroidobacter agaridevorans]